MRRTAPRLDRAGVEQPQSSGRVHDRALHRDQPLGGGRLGVLVDVGIRERELPAVAELGQVNSTSSPQRGVADEDAPVVGDGDAGRHLVVKGVHELRLAGGALGGKGVAGEGMTPLLSRSPGPIAAAIAHSLLDPVASRR